MIGTLELYRINEHKQTTEHRIMVYADRQHMQEDAITYAEQGWYVVEELDSTDSCELLHHQAN